MSKVDKSIRNVSGRITADGYRIVHGGHYVADIYGNMAEELMQLFAMAPEMLATLKVVNSLLRQTQLSREGEMIRDEVKAVIALAEWRLE